MTKKKFSAFHGDQAIKDKYIARIKAHMQADEIIQGTGFDARTNKGCAVGCTLDKYSHIAYEEELGIPFTIAFIEDRLFESLSVDSSKSFPLEFLEAVPVSADLSLVFNKMEIFDLDFLKDNMPDESSKEICADLIVLHEKVISGIEISDDDWKSIAYRTARTARADLAARAYLAYLAYRADLAARAYLAYLAYRADLAARAYRAYRADRADIRRAKFIELIKAS